MAMREYPSDVEERLFWEAGYRHVAGVDEAGRGPLAGPVVAAAVILDPANAIDGLDDSKRLSEKKREALAKEIQAKALAYSVVHRDAATIDRINILQATKDAMADALNQLMPACDAALVDAVQLPHHPSYVQKALVRGDQRSISIAAASILAKVSRDQLLLDYDLQWPEYGFAAHKGYGTKRHYEALDRLGPIEIHRKSFLIKWEAKRNEELRSER